MASKRVTELHLAHGFYEKTLNARISSLDRECLRHCRAWHCAQFTSCATNILEVQRVGKRDQKKKKVNGWLSKLLEVVVHV